jgi:phosphoglycolate phosphatase
MPYEKNEASHLNNLPYQLLIFDFDGTLMNSIQHIVESVMRAAKEAGVDPLPDPDFIRDGIGLSVEDQMQRIFAEYPKSMHDKIYQYYRQHFVSGAGKPAFSLFQGVDSLLKGLRAQGYWLAIATSKSRAGLDRDLVEFGITNHFLATRTVDEGFSKPHPGMIESLLTELGVEKKSALMIGDATYDLQMAKNANVDSVGVVSGVHGAEMLASCSPKACLPSVLQLPEFLEQAATLA